MSKASTYQCPNCNGVLHFDPESGHLICDFCGGSFEQGEFEKDIPVSAEAVERQDVAHVKTVDEFLERAPWATLADGQAGAVAYSCSACGAHVVADQAAVTAACPYCGNNMLVSGIANAGNVPQKVLPFAVTREQAEARMREHFEHKWYLSRKFDASLEHMQGVYVPYHLYDVDVRGRASYIGYHEERDEDRSTKTFNAMKRAGRASFEKIPVDGSSKMPDGHMDAVAPFSLDAMRGFSSSYIAGYLTEVPDETAEECLPRAEERARNSFERDLRADAVAEKRVDGIEEVVLQETSSEVKGISSCVLPVWLMHCAWDEHQMLFAVNGETGKCVGDLPIDRKRRVLTIVALAVVTFIVMFLISAVMQAGDAEKSRGVFIGGIILAVIVPLIADGIFRGQMKTAVEATTAGMSYTSEGLVVTDRWSTGKFYMRKSKARSKLEEEGV